MTDAYLPSLEFLQAIVSDKVALPRSDEAEIIGSLRGLRTLTLRASGWLAGGAASRSDDAAPKQFILAGVHRTSIFQAVCASLRIGSRTGAQCLRWVESWALPCQCRLCQIESKASFLFLRRCSS